MNREEFIKKRKEEVLSRKLPEKVAQKPKPRKPESKGESVVRYFLQYNKIEFETEKEFPDLHGEHGGLLRYDFYVPSLNTLIEYDGEQHYKVGYSFAKTKKDLATTKHHDNLKNKYAAKNNYHLVRIPFYDLEKAHIILKNRLTYAHERIKFNYDKKWKNGKIS